MRLKTKKKLPKYKPVELFTSIDDMWLHNWERLNSAPFDMKWLIVSDRERARKQNIKSETYQKAYFKLHNEYSEATGGSEKIEEWRTLVIQRMEARLKYAKGDKIQINFIRNFDMMIETLMKSDGPVSMVKQRMAYQQAYGMHINPKTTTVKEFIEITELVQEQNRAKTTSEDD